jgi:putative ABC transport system permease protein
MWSGLWRKRTRTLLTMLSIVVAFILFGILQGVDSSFKHLVDQGRLNVLITTNPAGLQLPLADLQQISAVDGVTGVTYRSLLIGSYQSLRNIVIVLAVDPKPFLDMNPMILVAPAARAALLATRTGALMTESLARRLNWKLGDHVPLRALNAPRKDGTSDWTFDIVGTFDMPDSPAREQSLLLVNYPYYDTARATETGTVQMYSETIADASRAAAIASAIDNLFANSSARTRTETEKASAQTQLAQLGDLDFFVDAVVAAAFATLLLVIGSTLMQSYRERVRDFAVMKTLGFSDLEIAALVVGEAVLLCVGAALIGLLIARGLLPTFASLAAGQIPGVRLPAAVFAAGIGAAALLALLTALPPAVQARRLTIIEALARR